MEWLRVFAVPLEDSGVFPAPHGGSQPWEIDVL